MPREVLRAGKRTVKWALRREFERRYSADVAGYVYLDEFGLDVDGRVWPSPRSGWRPYSRCAGCG